MRACCEGVNICGSNRNCLNLSNFDEKLDEELGTVNQMRK